MDFLLDKAALKGLSEEDQKYVKDEALSKFLLGSVFGGRGIASGYEAVQNIIPGMQKQRQQQGLLSELQGINKDFFPTPEQATQKAYANLPENTSFDYNPTPEAAYRQQQILNTTPDYGALQTRLAQLALKPGGAAFVPGLASVFGQFKPNITDGVVTDINNRPTSFIPKVDTRSGTFTTGTMQDGQPSFQTNVLPGAARAAALNTLPELEKGQQYVFDNNQNVIGLMDVNGKLQSLAARTATETAAREANIPRPSTTAAGAPTFTFVQPPGLQSQTGVGAAIAQPATGLIPQQVTGPSTAQATLNAAFKPILDDAYKGYQAAKKTAPVIDQLQNAYNQPGFDTGSFTNVRTQLGNVFNSLGVSGERNKQFLTNAISARQGINALTGESLSEAVGAISNFEIGYYGQRNAQITDPKESTNFNLAVLREANKRKQDYYNFVSDPKNAGPDVLAKWETSAQGQKQMFESPGLRKYLPQFQVKAGPEKGKTAYQLPSGVYRVYD